MIRLVFVIIFALLVAVLAFCAFIAYRSSKPAGKPVSILCMSLIPPVLGNMIIVGSTIRTLSLAGCYTYYIGMDLIMLALIGFTDQYCRLPEENGKKTHRVPKWLYLLLISDVVQLALNPVFHQAFDLQEIEVYGSPYFLLIPFAGQMYHRAVCYITLAMVMITFAIMCIKMPRVYRERYTVILISMVIGTLWQTFYIFSRTPIDRSMIGFAVFGLLIFYFSMYHRPVRLLDRMLANIVSDRKEAIFLYGPEGKCIWANEPGIKLTGGNGSDFESADAALNKLFGDLSLLPERKDTEFETGSEEDTRCYTIDRSSVRDERGKLLGSYINVRETTEEKHRIANQIYAANHDPLTGLYSKKHLYEKITERLSRKELTDYYIAFIDIRSFKIVNDVFGRDFGDYALGQVADWIRKYSDERCIYGRLAGDTFGSCLPKELVAEDVIEQDLSRFVVKKGDLEHHLEINIGFYDTGDQDADVSISFDRARMALVPIRDDFKKHVAFYDSRLKEKARWDQELISQLRPALEGGQILPYLQPIADRDGKIVGAEALARWIHPKYGFMSPADFIPLFEGNGMIVDVDMRIWRSVCEILAEWKTSHPGLFLSVNISPKDFYLTDVFSNITDLVKEYDVDPKDLRIEITESSMMNNTDDRISILERFRALGFIVEMDDFGSGYSSLNMLKDMPVDVLKIDMKFLGRSKDVSRSRIIVKNIIKLSDDLGIATLTEGVETIEQFDILAEMGCMLFQGYYFSKPVPLADFEDMLDRQGQ